MERRLRVVNALFTIAKTGPRNGYREHVMLEDVHERLASVVIENLGWLDFIDRYDRPGTLFYLDPSYFGSEDDYGKALLGRDKFAAMAER
ncbi:hypothetical protein [Sinorhizobium fredii]|uniref:hypothetical protein n=1 Tax=Rhizobium fredii TaxID=380 RepID=UPI0006879F47